MRVIVTLACTECGDRNYTTTKNKKTHPGRLELKKILPASEQSDASSGNEITNTRKGRCQLEQSLAVLLFLYFWVNILQPASSWIRLMNKKGNPMIGDWV